MMLAFSFTHQWPCLSSADNLCKQFGHTASPRVNLPYEKDNVENNLQPFTISSN